MSASSKIIYQAEAHDERAERSNELYESLGAETPITYDAMHQLILGHHVTTLVVMQHFHKQLGHYGQERLLSRLREEFWIVNERTEIKRLLGQCIVCKRRYAERMTQEIMVGLPKVSDTVRTPLHLNRD